MILKMPPPGRGVRGLDEYVTNKVSSVLVASNMAGQTPRERAREIAGLRSGRPDLGKAVGHLVLSHDPSLPDLTLEQWHLAIDIARSTHDLRDAPFVAQLHSDVDHRHIHLFFCGFDLTGVLSRIATAGGRTRRLPAKSSGNWVCPHRGLLGRTGGLATGVKPITRIGVGAESIKARVKFQ